jgi:hypothetical protein
MKIAFALLILLSVFTTGCAGILPGTGSEDSDDVERERFLEAMAVFNGGSSENHNPESTDTMRMNYINQMQDKDRETSRKARYIKNSLFPFLIEIAGGIIGGVWGYNWPNQHNSGVGDIRWIGEIIGAAIGIIPGAILMLPPMIEYYFGK